MALAIVVIASGCVRSASDACEDGSTCPEGRRCHAVAATQTIECVTPEQLAQCDGKDDGATCASGTCFSGACLPAGCNNRRIDPMELCDDGNNIPGDGCSADCRSRETCGNGIVDPVRLVGDEFVLGEQCDDTNFVGHDGCSSSCEPETHRAINIAKIPRRRVGAAMVTDVASRRIILFGGRVGEPAASRTINDTWELDEEGWTELRIGMSPPPRADHAMAFGDAQIVLFGGGDTDQALADTWTFADNRWTVVPTPVAPPARTNHAMAFLPGTGVVMIGGMNDKGAVLADMWIFAQGEWRQFTGTVPGARAQHTLTLDPVRNVLVLTAGVTGPLGDRILDTWEFDGTTWVQLSAQTPDVYDATAVFDRAHGRVVLDGGYQPTTIINQIPMSTVTYAWDGQTWSTITDTGPGLAAQASATDPITGEMIEYGGTRFNSGPNCQDCVTVFDDTARLQGTSWVLRPFVEIPSIRGVAAANDPLRRRVVLYLAGATFELGSGSWIARATTGPPARNDAAMAHGWFGSSPVSILFGGAVGTAIRPDAMWTWSGATWTERTPPSMPPARYRHAMAYDAHNQHTILVGGETASGIVGDSWAWDGNAWTQLMGVQVTPRADHAMAYDPIRQVVLVFGGTVNGDVLRDFWQLDATGWTELEPAFGPGARSGAAMAWDPARQRIVLSGGTPSSDAWEWDGAQWTFVNGDLDERDKFAMVSAPTGAGVVAISGSASVGKATSQLVWSTGEADYAACRAQIDDDNDGKIGCDEPECWATCTPTCPPGTSCDPSAPRCGDGVCDAPREGCGRCSDCPCP